MRYPSPPPGSRDGGPTSWMGHKERGKDLYNRGRYEEALASYRAALNPEYRCPNQERQILLSNIVACRLKVGGPAQFRAAVEDAKQCVQVNPSWSKGHVRLASAYIALGGRSNDACNELQTALRLDPGNSLARQMLMRELRRDHAAAAAAAAASATDDEPSSAFDDRDGVGIDGSFGGDRSQEDPRPPPQNPNYDPPPRYRPDPAEAVPIDDSLSLADRIRFYLSRAGTWYSDQSDDFKTAINVGMVVLVLYIAFGGRFGLEGLLGNDGRDYAGNYGTGNAYDQYQRRDSNYYGGHGYGGGGWARNHHDHGYGGGYYSSHRNHYGGGFSFWEGGLPSMLILIGVGYVCHLNGINPFHAIWMLNLFGRRRGRMGVGGGMYYGGGMRRGYYPRRRF